MALCTPHGMTGNLSGTGGPTQRLQDLLVLPHEDLGVELKGWLGMSSEDHRAGLAQALLALANYGGGFILLGFMETGGGWVPATPRPPSLDSYSQDCVNGIVQHYADPAFHCGVQHVPDPQTSDLFPIVIVPGGHKVPIRAKRDGPDGRHIRQNTYYIRRPGPRSEPPQSGREWDELIGRCVRAARDELLERFREIMSGSGGASPSSQGEERRLTAWTEESMARWNSVVSEKLAVETPSRYSSGIWFVSYSIVGNLQRPSLGDLLETLRRVRGHETGWPPWWVPSSSEIAPYVHNGRIECWLGEGHFRDAAHSDFWRASPDGMMFLLRGYQEDSQARELQPGTILDLTVPIWRIGECLLHAQRLAPALGDQSASVIFHATWKGLSGRTLTSWANPRRMHLGGGASRQDTVSSEIRVPADQISATLPEIVGKLTIPLYEIFDFFTPTPALIQEELLEMRKGLRS